VNLVLDAGALIGVDRDDRRTAGLIELGRRSGAELVTSAPVVAQAWRGSARQARSARLLAMIVGCIALIKVPFGTALGIYTLWVLISHNGEQEYAALSAQAGRG